MEADFFVCNICTQPYDLDLRQPIVCFTCGHSLCAECKERVENGNCPHCRSPGIRNAPINQEVLRQMRLENQEMYNEENIANGNGNENNNQDIRDNNDNESRNETRLPKLPALLLAAAMIPVTTTGTHLIAALVGL